MKRFFIVGVILFISLSPVRADSMITVHPALTAPAAPAAVPIPASAPTPEAATQNTITTTAPVTSNTTISTGTVAGTVLTWAATAFGGVLTGAITTLIYRLFNEAGIRMSDAARARLQEIVVNGLNIGAKIAAENLAGKGQVEVKNEVVAQAVAYTQAHGAATIKTLGLDPTSGAAVEAIKARIETAIADPNTPTPAVLGAPAAPKQA